MDPLSVTASAIAVAGAVKQTARLIRKVRALTQAPAELKALLNEAVDFHNVLQQVAAAATAGKDAVAVHGLDWQIRRASEKMEEFDAMIREHSSAGTNRIGIHSGHFSWARGRARAETLQAELKLMRLNLCNCLAASTSSAIARVENALSLLSTRQSQEFHALSNLLTQVVTTAPLSEHFVAEEVTCDDTRCPKVTKIQFSVYGQVTGTVTKDDAKMTRKLAQVHPTPSSGNLSVWQKRTTSLCKDWCSCSCHKKTALRMKPTSSYTFGAVSVSFAGLPGLSQPCDEKSCQRKASPSIAVTCYFPGWISDRYLSMALASSLYGPEMNVKLPRKVDWFSPWPKMALDGDIAGLKGLFATGAASPWDVTPLGGSMMHYAADHGHFEMCQFLLEHGAEPMVEDDLNTNPAELAWEQVLGGTLHKDDEDKVKTIFGATDYIETRQFTVLHKIVLGLIPRTLKQLQQELDISTKDLDTRDASGRTCVSWAAARGDAATLRTLLSFGADPNICDTKGLAPLHGAQTRECVTLLSRAGANVNAKTPWGFTPLMQACRDMRSPLIISQLIADGADVNALNTSNETALHAAILKRDTPNALLLLDNGADPDLPLSAGFEGQSALQFAVAFDANDILAELVERPGMHYATPILGFNQTVLHTGARLASADTLRTLARAGRELRGLDIDARDAKGKTAREYLEEREVEDGLEDIKAAFEEVVASAVACDTVELETSKLYTEEVKGLIEVRMTGILTPDEDEDNWFPAMPGAFHDDILMSAPAVVAV